MFPSLSLFSFLLTLGRPLTFSPLMSFCLAGPWQSVLPPPSPLDIRSPEKKMISDFSRGATIYNTRYDFDYNAETCFVMIFGDASRILKCDNFQVVVTLVL